MKRHMQAIAFRLEVIAATLTFVFFLCSFHSATGEECVGPSSVNTDVVSTSSTGAVWENVSGYIGPYRVFMHINIMAERGEYCGYYYYTDRPKSRFSLKMIRNESAMAGCRLTVYEYTDNGNHTGTFSGYFSTRGTNFSGTFTNTRTGKKYKFELYN